MPHAFSDDPMIGNQRIVDFLTSVRTRQLLHHAFLFFGPAHVGKSYLARLFCQAILCSSPATSGIAGCGACQSCQALHRQVHPDFVHLERLEDSESGKQKTQISIAQVRQLQTALDLRPFYDGYKVALIQDADTLSSEATNALLKTLEEPAGKSVIILVCNALGSVPATIRSRCQLAEFTPVSFQEMLHGLTQRGFGASQTAQAAGLAMGRPGLALRFLETPEAYEAQLAKLDELLAAIAAPLEQRFALIQRVLQRSDARAAVEMLAGWRRIFRDMLLLRTGNSAYLTVPARHQELQTLAGRYALVRLAGILGRIDTIARYLDANVNPRLAMENVALSF